MRKQPKQTRSIKTRKALTAALESLLKEKDFDQISVAEIASTACVSTGLLYSHFKNKADFLEALLETYKERIVKRLEEAESEDVSVEYRNAGSLREALRIISNYTYQQLQGDAHIIRALSQHLRARPESEQAEWQDLRTRAALTLTAVLDVYSDDLARTDRQLTEKIFVYFFNSIFYEVIQNRKLGNISVYDLPSEVFTVEIADIIYGYLTTSPM
ncbi:TetR/AcrR family transcriptional regulator [Alteromonadaceae bacterium M269]|nr:TetR/AcrR family transcriptional regulator [Alteromonadaceae bacterium M269]